VVRRDVRKWRRKRELGKKWMVGDAGMLVSDI